MHLKLIATMLFKTARIDGDPLIVEYEGETPAEYPGDDRQFSISGYNYDARRWHWR